MSWLVKARSALIDVHDNYDLFSSGEKSVTPPKSSNDTEKHRAEVSTSSDEPKSLWSRLKEIIVDAWHKIIKTIIKG